MKTSKPVKNAAAVLVAICIGSFLATFNETFLNVGLASIMKSFSITSGQVQWVSTVFSGSLLTAGISFLVGIICLIIFVRRQSTLPEALLDLRPFKDHAFVTGVAVVFIAFMAVFAMNILLPLYMENALGFSAFDAALTLLIPCLSCVFFAPVAGHLYDRFGFRFSLPAALLVMSGFLFLMTRVVSGAATGVMLAACYLPILAGCNFSIGPAQSFALDRLSSELHPHGVTVCYTAIQVAGCIGSSFYVGIMSRIEQTACNSGAAATAAVTQGFQGSVTVASVLALVGFVFAVLTVKFSK